jgi:hypothetical protein
MPRAGPAMVAMRSPAVRPLDGDLDRRVDQPERHRRRAEPRNDAALARDQRGSRARGRRHDRVGGQVAGAT